MSLPETVREHIEPLIGPITRVEPVGGGCIAHATRVVTAGGSAFLKWADGSAGKTFEAEAAGLRALARAGSSLLIPGVVAALDASHDAPGFILLSWIDRGAPDRDFARRLGKGLAELHAHHQPDGRYGFEQDNFIGRLPQRNDWRGDWPSFFREMRLEPQIAMAREAGRWRRTWDADADRLLAGFDHILPITPASSMCHGDLWSGNVMCSSTGVPVLIDPAAYYGHGESDLAMMTLFGGFQREVFDAYHHVHPRRQGHLEREAIYQLYHLINHLNHFGSSYAGGVERALRRSRL